MLHRSKSNLLFLICYIASGLSIVTADELVPPPSEQEDKNVVLSYEVEGNNSIVVPDDISKVLQQLNEKRKQDRVEVERKLDWDDDWDHHEDDDDDDDGMFS
jgi:hypothetical protein